MIDSYHILRRPGAQTWTAVPHTMLHGLPIPYDEAVQQVLIGHSCYVVAEEVDTAIAQLAQLKIIVEKQAPPKGR